MGLAEQRWKIAEKLVCAAATAAAAAFGEKLNISCVCVRVCTVLLVYLVSGFFFSARKAQNREVTQNTADRVRRKPTKSAIILFLPLNWIYKEHCLCLHHCRCIFVSVSTVFFFWLFRRIIAELAYYLCTEVTQHTENVAGRTATSDNVFLVSELIRLASVLVPIERQSATAHSIKVSISDHFYCVSRSPYRGGKTFCARKEKRPIRRVNYEENSCYNRAHAACCCCRIVFSLENKIGTHSLHADHTWSFQSVAIL